jgi:hypothetical protein
MLHQRAAEGMVARQPEGGSVTHRFSSIINERNKTGENET